MSRIKPSPPSLLRGNSTIKDTKTKNTMILTTKHTKNTKYFLNFYSKLEPRNPELQLTTNNEPCTMNQLLTSNHQHKLPSSNFGR
jgi:hypothetical protein